MLEERINAYKELKDDKKALRSYVYKTETEYKQEFEWLEEVDSIALQQSRKDLVDAYTNFFKSVSHNRKGFMGFPKFHNKGRKDKYRTQNVNSNIKVDTSKRKIKLPILGWITYRDPRIPEGKIKNATVSKTKTGKYFVSVLLEKEVPDPKQFDVEAALDKGLEIKGLDMSFGKFYVDDQGNSPEFVKLFEKNQKKLAHLQLFVSKRQKGGKNRHKAQLRVNKIYEKIANSRKDFVEKLSTKLINENDVIVVETLDLEEMAQKYGKSVHELAYNLFVNRLQDKALDNGKVIIKANKWFASSKTCSVCGYIKEDLTIDDRKWTCPNCGTHHDRDLNAGQNLRDYGLDIILGQGLPDVKPVERALVDDRDEKSFPKKQSIEKPEISGKKQESHRSLVDE